ncbi:hypothetical protein ACVW0C_001083, partial [Thermostichus sp. OS-CIW-26]
VLGRRGWVASSALYYPIPTPTTPSRYPTQNFLKPEGIRIHR